jgi:hypothetical protein
MTRSSPGSLPLAVLALAVLARAVAAGAPAPVGGRCDPGADPEAAQTVFISPSLDCESRVCLRVAGEGELDPSMCTADCASDDDCVGEPDSPCEGGFTCAIAAVTGPFCCQPVCVCRDYLPTDGAPDPAACDADLPENTCANLAGRG